MACVHNAKYWNRANNYIYKILDLDKSLNEEGAVRTSNIFQPTAWRWTRYADSSYFDLDKKLKDYSEKEWDLFLYALSTSLKNRQVNGEKPHFMKD